MPHFLSLLRKGSLARPRNRSVQVPNSEVLAARLALFRHLVRQDESLSSYEMAYQHRDYGSGRVRCSNLV
jgi:hypothetical protein